MLDKINHEFIDYVESQGFATDLIENPDFDRIDVKPNCGSIYFLRNSADIGETEFTSADTVISPSGDIVRQDRGLILHAGRRERIGSNSLGEEYVRFLSRYRIRFDRLD